MRGEDEAEKHNSKALSPSPGVYLESVCEHGHEQDLHFQLVQYNILGQILLLTELRGQPTGTTPSRDPRRAWGCSPWENTPLR